jgi:biofilm PGA synthesis N-glycosyltransferase PgaC
MLPDNNSTDRTAEVAEFAALGLGLRFRRIFEPVAGKHHALNTALVEVSTPLVVTVDADTLLHAEALTYLIARVAGRPQDQHVCACAGALLAENAVDNFLTRMQGWDYRLGINGVKRTQAAYNSALAAQGAVSAYWTEDIRAVGGWPDAIGEDIVLTWRLMDSRGLVQYEPCAPAGTVVPVRVRHFMRRRSRWARGMIEGSGSTRRRSSSRARQVRRRDRPGPPGHDRRDRVRLRPPQARLDRRRPRFGARRRRGCGRLVRVRQGGRLAPR